ncbi:MAG: divalent-cation tolerance protein CutA [Nitrospirae bacterium]|nr:divalent-cation tolerance protein CutA [Nitrospirota bacterium]
MSDAVVILVTTPSIDDARKIGNTLVEEKLIACANIIPQVESIFYWQDKVRNEKEALMIIKTQKKLIDKVIKRVKSLHSYTVPEIIALPIIKGSKDYIKWVKEATKGH